jgi:curved DNA-binding protein
MEYKDYYKMMGLERTASADDIKKAYRKLARKYHPDVSKEPNAEEKFKSLGEAYEVLKDPEKRTAYDQLGENWQAGQEFKPPPGWNHPGQQGGGGFSGFSGAEDFFESLFGGGGMGSRHNRQRHSAKGENYHGKVHITLEEAFAGTVRQIQIPITKPNAYGNMERSTKTLKVKIPAGVSPGKQIRLSGQGAPGVGGGKAGDVLLEVEFEKHPIFDVINNDVYATIPIAPWEAALGASISIPTLAGKVELKIPKHSQAGQKLRLKQRGLPGTPTGDQFIVLKIVIPQPNNQAAIELYEKMAKEMPFNPREQLGV